ncbi:MAG: hypothetical protein IJX76_04920 [Clostridia bacterium]|nr:hypothetical protein [Clostridia bacterium]
MAEQRSFSNLGAYDDLDRIILYAAEIIANQSPYDTGTLRFNAIKVEWVDVEHTEFRIYIDESAIARIAGGFNYAKWLNESPDSPHRGWWDRACLDAVNYLRRVLG